MKLERLLIALIILVSSYQSFGQAQQAAPYFTYGKGLGMITPDSSYSLNIRFRIQNRAAFKTMDINDFGISEVEARVRRMRLRFDGFVLTPRLTYLIQLSFSRGDMDVESLPYPNVLRDAYIQYAVTKHFSVGFGQTKLPGNRQRVNSSGDLQFVDRSIVSGTFNIDRDFGLQFQQKMKHVVVKGAISSGEGRNFNVSGSGLSYTGRVEFLPFGAFTNNGDYFEGDLAREKKQKVSIGLAYNLNEKASRTGGQLGNMLYGTANIETQIVDFLYKYNGWSFAYEFMKRLSPTPVTTNAAGDQRYVYVGSGHNYQGGYIFKNNIEIAARYSIVTPQAEINTKEHQKEHYTLGLNKYLKGHRVKLQNNITLERVHKSTLSQAWIYTFQIELGI
jgi:phosphate-selective porin OprO/OprP